MLCCGRPGVVFHRRPSEHPGTPPGKRFRGSHRDSDDAAQSHRDSDDAAQSSQDSDDAAHLHRQQEGNEVRSLFHLQQVVNQISFKHGDPKQGM